MPWSRTKSFPSPFTSVKQPFPWINYMSYGTVERLIWLGISDVINDWRVQTLKLKPIWTLSARGHRLLHDHAVPFIYPWSDKILPKPADWGDHICVPGYFFLEDKKLSVPIVDPPDVSPDLLRFLAGGSPPVYIGFGSIVVKRPAALRKKIMDAILKVCKKEPGVRFLLQEGWGGMFTIKDDEEHLFLQVLEEGSHHGPSTSYVAFGKRNALSTAALERRGSSKQEPTLVVPFFGDQFFWDKLLCRSGAGRCLPFKSLSADRLGKVCAVC